MYVFAIDNVLFVF